MARTRTDPDENKEQSQQEETAASDSRRRRRSRREKITPKQETANEVARKDRPTPSARQGKPRGAGSTGLLNRIWGVRHFAAYLRGVNSELQKVTWPSREETTRLTLIVLAVTAAFAIALGSLDAFFGWWFRRAFHGEDTTFMLVALGVAAVVGGTYTLFRNRI